jgi:hypothetical protein
MPLRKNLLATAALLLACSPAAFAQSAPGYATPKTSWGAPDLSGFWTNESRTAMNRPDGATSSIVSEAEERALLAKNIYTLVEKDESGASDVSVEGSKKMLSDANSNRGYNRFWMEPGKNFARVKGTIRSSWVIEPADTGKIPYKQEYMASRMNRLMDYSSYETRPLEERCLRGFTNGAGPVINNGMYNNNYQIVQSPTHVMIFAEMINDARTIPIFKSKAEAHHGPKEIKNWTGDSIAWYEGDALVIETTNIYPKQTGFITENGKTTERFSRWDDNQLTYEFEVEDPMIYTQPWKGEMAFNKSAAPPYEYACHEGNYGLFGILAGARQLEADGREHPPIKATFDGVEE